MLFCPNYVRKRLALIGQFIPIAHNIVNIVITATLKLHVCGFKIMAFFNQTRIVC